MQEVLHWSCGWRRTSVFLYHNLCLGKSEKLPNERLKVRKPIFILLVNKTHLPTSFNLILFHLPSRFYPFEKQEQSNRKVSALWLAQKSNAIAL